MTALPERISEIVDEVCRLRKVDRVVVLSDSTCQVNSNARDEIWWRARQLRKANGRPFSFTMLGRMFARDHSSICTAAKRFEKRMPEWAAELQDEYAAKLRNRRAELIEAGVIHVKAAAL